MLKRILATIAFLALSTPSLADAEHPVDAWEERREQTNILTLYHFVHFASTLAEEVGGREAGRLAGSALRDRFREAAIFASGEDAVAAVLAAVSAEAYQQAKAVVQGAMNETTLVQDSEYIWAPVAVSSPQAVARASWRQVIDGGLSPYHSYWSSVAEAFRHAPKVESRPSLAALKKARNAMALDESALAEWKQMDLIALVAFIHELSRYSTELELSIDQLLEKPEWQEVKQAKNRIKPLKSTAIVVALWPAREDHLERLFTHLIGFFDFVREIAGDAGPGLAVSETVNVLMDDLDQDDVPKYLEPLVKLGKLAVQQHVSEATALAEKENRAVDRVRLINVHAWKHLLDPKVFPKIPAAITVLYPDSLATLKGHVSPDLLDGVELDRFQNALLVERVFYLLQVQNIIDHFDAESRKELTPAFHTFLAKPEVKEAAEHFQRILAQQTPTKVGPTYERILADGPQALSADLVNMIAAFVVPRRIDWDRTLPLLRDLLAKEGD